LNVFKLKSGPRFWSGKKLTLAWLFWTVLFGGHKVIWRFSKWSLALYFCRAKKTLFVCH